MNSMHIVLVDLKFFNIIINSNNSINFTPKYNLIHNKFKKKSKITRLFANNKAVSFNKLKPQQAVD